MYQKLLDSYGESDDEVEIVYLNLAGDDTITFDGQMGEPIHRWFRLTAAFSPSLVRQCLERFDSRHGIDGIIDPFCGTGTTLLEAKMQGYTATGVEFNPVYKRVAHTKNSWPLDVDQLNHERWILRRMVENRQEKWEDIDVDDFEEELDISVPEIYNRERWWHDHALKDLLIIRQSIDDLNAPDERKELFHLALLSILVEASNATYNHVSLSFMDDPPERVYPLHLFHRKLVDMFDDLEEVAEKVDEPGSVTVINGDSTQLSDYISQGTANTVITSPPYPNRYSYVRETRPHMFFYDMVDDAGEVGEMALQSVGGTWGRATSQLEDTEIPPINDVVADVVGEVAPEFAEEDVKMRNYVVKYFNMMEEHLQEVERVLDSPGQVAYTVGNSKLKGVVVPTDEMLARMCRSHGYDQITIARARERNSKDELYEAVVFAAE